MSKNLHNFIVFRPQKDGSADRGWFCESYDGETTVGVKASNDVKRITAEVGSYALLKNMKKTKLYNNNGTSANIRLDEDVLKTSFVFVFRRRLHQDKYIRLNHSSSEDVLIKTNIFVLAICLQDVFKTSSRCLTKTSSRRFQDDFKASCKNVFQTSSRRFEDLFKTSSRHLQDVLPRHLQDVSQRCLQDVDVSSG